MAASGAMLLAASVLPGLAQAEEPATTVILDPATGSLFAGTNVRTSGPCPEGSTNFSLVMAGLGFVGGGELAADRVPNATLALFADDNPPTDGVTYTLSVNCVDPGGATTLASIPIKVTGNTWTAVGPSTPPTTPPTSEPPTSGPPTIGPPTSGPPTSQPPTGSASASVSPTSAAPHALVQVTLTGFGVAEIVDRELRPAAGGEPVLTGTQGVGADGSGTAPAQIPDAPPGAYKFVFRGPDSGRTAEVAFTITGPQTSGPPTSGPPTSGPPTSEPPSGTPTGTGTATPTATDTGPGGTDGGNSGGGDSGGSSGGDSGGSGGTSGGGGGGLAHTGAMS
ncbi:MAG: hypothetical protein HOV68_11485, partial [Streptomycetaceae bacterium]|nr:hypothetical protein [Streptomycetaceae bacterium]